MAVTRIIILVEYPFGRRDFDRFGVELLSKTFQVSILDCTAWLKPEFAANYRDIVLRCPGYSAIPDMDTLTRRLDEPGEAIAIDYLGDGARCARIRRELRTRGIRRAVVHNGLLPEPVVAPSAKMLAILRSSAPLSFVGKLWRRTMRVLRPEPVPDIALMSGTAGLSRNRMQRIDHKVWAHSFDFDTYLATVAEAVPAPPPYAVFLDEDMIYHPEYEHAGIKSAATEEAYYASMHGAFEEIERAYGVSIVVAAHPRSRYDLRPTLWRGRTTVQGRTAELVRGARLVLCHQSTAVSFAVLWRKPIWFLTTDELMSSYLQARIFLGSTLLRAPLINVDQTRGMVAHASLLDVDDAAYAKYADDYIKRRGTPDRPAWQIFSDYIKGELDRRPPSTLSQTV